MHRAALRCLGAGPAPALRSIPGVSRPPLPGLCRGRTRGVRAGGDTARGPAGGAQPRLRSPRRGTGGTGQEGREEGGPGGHSGAGAVAAAVGRRREQGQNRRERDGKGETSEGCAEGR